MSAAAARAALLLMVMGEPTPIYDAVVGVFHLRYPGHEDCDLHNAVHEDGAGGYVIYCCKEAFLIDGETVDAWRMREGTLG